MLKIGTKVLIVDKNVYINNGDIIGYILDDIATIIDYSGSSLFHYTVRVERKDDRWKSSAKTRTSLHKSQVVELTKLGEELYS